VNEPVPLTTAPNVPMAEVLCGRLKDAGIPSYYRGTSGTVGFLLGGSAVNPANPVEIYVRPDDLARARQLIDDAPRAD
jgi:hypothetical protein